MGILGSIFGTEKGISKAMDGIYNGVDKAFFTKEEKAANFLLLLKAYEPFKRAQRVLAFIVVPIYLLVWLVSVGFFIASGFADTEVTSKALFATAMSLGASNHDTLGTATALILGFYFGGGAAEGIIGKFMTSKAEKEKN